MEGRIALPLLLLVVSGLHAGPYNPFEPEEERLLADFFDPKTGGGFERVLMKYRGFSDKFTLNDPQRQRYQFLGDAPLGPADKWSVEQKLGLSEYLIRRGRFLEARELLRPLERDPDVHFLVLANLANAAHREAETRAERDQVAGYDAAHDLQFLALKRWPRSWPELEANPKFLPLVQALGWHERQFRHYRLAEEYYLKLLDSRRKETRQMKKRTDTLDPLFTDAAGQPVRYYDPDPEAPYPIKLPPEEHAKFPNQSIDQAILILQQLLVWLPFDARLQWQLGEIYAAKGDIYSAQKVFTNLSKSLNYRPREVARHGTALLAIKTESKKGDLVDENIVDNPPAEKKDESERPIDARTFLVGVGTGIVVALFAAWQVAEIRRRRQRA